MKKDSIEINLSGFEPLSKLNRQRQGEEFIAFYTNYNRICVSKALSERLRIKCDDQVNIFYNHKKDSVAIQFGKEGAFTVRANLSVSCSALFHTLNHQGLGFEKRIFNQGEFNIDVVNRIIECPFK